MTDTPDLAARLRSGQFTPADIADAADAVDERAALRMKVNGLYIKLNQARAAQQTSGEWVVPEWATEHSKAKSRAEAAEAERDSARRHIAELYVERDTAIAERDERCDCAKLSELAHKLKAMEDRAHAAEAERDELREKLDDERAGVEILDEAGMDANDKLSVLAALVLDLKLANPYGQKVKAYARYALNDGPNPLEQNTGYGQDEGSISHAAEAEREAEALEVLKLLQDEQFYTGHSPSTRTAFALAERRIRELESTLAEALEVVRPFAHGYWTYQKPSAKVYCYPQWSAEDTRPMCTVGELHRALHFLAKHSGTPDTWTAMDLVDLRKRQDR